MKSSPGAGVGVGGLGCVLHFLLTAAWVGVDSLTLPNPDPPAYRGGNITYRLYIGYNAEWGYRLLKLFKHRYNAMIQIGPLSMQL